MKKSLLFIVAAMIATLQVSAAPVDVAKAKATAQQYLAQKVYAGKIMAPAATEPVLLKTEMGIVNKTTPVYYIFNTSTSFIIVSGDDRAEEVLAYGDRPLNLNRIPENMKGWLSTYKEQIDFLISNPNLEVEKPTTFKSPKVRATVYGPLLTEIWDQSDPFWNQCKFGNYQCLTGCPATSASMVFHYWKYPTAPTPVVPGYQSTISTSSYSSVNYTHTALPSVTFDWNNMLDDYTGSYTTEQGNAVATLMHYVGQAERMGYGTESAGGSGVDADSVCNIANAFTFFGYDPNSVHFVKKTSAYSGGTTLYTDAQWAAMIQEEIIANRPIVFCAVSNYGGHAFNVDGYDSSTNKYHINFGWSGDGDSWCALNSFGYSYYNFNQYQQMVIGIQPPASYFGPNISASEQEINLTSNVGESTTATFTVTGGSLEQDITATLADANGVFSITPTNISMSQAENGQVVTVTFAPQSLGNYTGTITLKSSNADDVTVTLNGRAVYPAPVMLPANESYININRFRADWTDETPDANLASYTLELNKPVPPSELIGSINGANYTGNYADITLPAPWGGKNVRGGYGAIYFRNSISYTPSPGNITFTIPEGYDNYIFTMKITTSSSQYGTGNYTVETPQTAAVGQNFTSNGQTHEWLVTASSGEKITITSTDDSYSPDIALIQVYSGDATTSGAGVTYLPYRLITGINNKYCDVTELEDEGTYLYRVKAIYNDNSESDWSNMEQVTLFANTSGKKGDVNGDGEVDLNDLTTLINYLLDKNPDQFNFQNADVNESGVVDLNDLTGLINMLL